MSVLNCCTAWTLMKRLQKKLDGNYTRMLPAVLNRSWKQHLTIQQLYGHIPPISQTIQVRGARHTGHYWRSKAKLINNILPWTTTHGHTSVGRPAKSYIHQLFADTACHPEDLPRMMALIAAEKSLYTYHCLLFGKCICYFLWPVLYHSHDMAVCQTYIECL